MSAKGQTLGMIGLGRTGLPFAKNLMDRGHTVIGYRRSHTTEFFKAGGVAAKTPREVAENAKIVFSCLPSPSALEDVLSGDDGLLSGLDGGHTLVEVSSYPLAFKEKVRVQLAERGANFIDGEISGTPAMTAARASVILISGDKNVCEPILEICKDASDHARFVGDFGSATNLKLVANVLVAVHTVAAAEAILLAERAGIDMKMAIDVLGLGAGASTMLKARAPSMVARQFVNPAPGPVAMLANYLEPIRALGESANSPLPLFSMASALFKRALDEGRAQHDIGCVIELLDTLKGQQS